MDDVGQIGAVAPSVSKLSPTETVVRSYMAFVRKHATVELPQALTDPEQRARNLIYVALHRDAFFTPLIVATARLPVAVLSSGSRNGRFLSRLCSEADPDNVTFVAVRRGGDRNGKRRARLEATHQVLEILKRRAVLLSVDRPDTDFGRGAILIAKRSGRPILPLVVEPRALSYAPLPSWDRLRVPMPFCRIVVKERPEIIVPGDASADEAKRIAVRLGEELGGNSRG